MEQRILDINIVVEQNIMIVSKWIVINNMFLKKDYKFVKNDYSYIIEFLHEHTYLSYKEIK